MCGSDTCKRLAGSWTSGASNDVTNEVLVSGPQLVISAMERYIKNPAIVKQSALAMSAICLRQPTFAERFVLCGAPEFLSKVTKMNILI